MLELLKRLVEALEGIRAELWMARRGTSRNALRPGYEENDGTAAQIKYTDDKFLTARDAAREEYRQLTGKRLGEFDEIPGFDDIQRS